jgi:hypothetical protein
VVVRRERRRLPVYYVSAPKTGAFNVGFDVTNTGRLPVKVVGLGSPTAFTLFQMGRYSTNDAPGGGPLRGRHRSLRAGDHAPGDSRHVVLQLKITDETVCTSPGSFGIHSHPPFRYRTLGFIPRTATVEAPFRVVTVCGDRLPPDYDTRS